jgi:hypothetical protein
MHTLELPALGQSLNKREINLIYDDDMHRYPRDPFFLQVDLSDRTLLRKLISGTSQTRKLTGNNQQPHVVSANLRRS